MTTGQNKKRAYGLTEMTRDFGPLTIARLLLSHRQAHGVSQARLAKTLRVSQQRLCDFEKGRRLPGLKNAYEMASRLGYHGETWVLVLLEEILRREKLNIRLAIAG
jgi:DNA-binding XRE family transcriptional regulator